MFACITFSGLQSTVLSFNSFCPHNCLRREPRSLERTAQSPGGCQDSIFCPKRRGILCHTTVGLSADRQFMILKRKVLSVPSSPPWASLGEPYCSGLSHPHQPGGPRHIFELEEILALLSFCIWGL